MMKCPPGTSAPVGGTGLIGSKLVERLREAGHDAVPASPHSGVDAYTGKGLEQPLEGAQVRPLSPRTRPLRR